MGYASTTLVFNEDLKSWMPEVGTPAQALLPVPGRGLYSLPLPGQATTPAGGYSLWRHRALPATGPRAQLAGTYGRGQWCHVDFVLVGTGPEVTKMLDNLVLVSQGPDPVQVEVRTSLQPEAHWVPVRGKGTDITRRTAERKEDHTYITIPGAEKRRGRWLRVRLAWHPDSSPDQSKLLKVVSVLRDSFS